MKVIQHRFQLMMPWSLYIAVHRMADEDIRSLHNTMLFLIWKEAVARGYDAELPRNWRDQAEELLLADVVKEKEARFAEAEADEDEDEDDGT